MVPQELRAPQVFIAIPQIVPWVKENEQAGVRKHPEP